MTDIDIIETFINTPLEGDYNFLRDDLIKIAHAFINKAKPEIAKEERAECVKFVRSLNDLVGDALEKRGT